MDAITLLQEEIRLHQEVLKLYEEGKKEEYKLELAFLERLLEKHQSPLQVEAPEQGDTIDEDNRTLEEKEADLLKIIQGGLT